MYSGWVISIATEERTGRGSARIPFLIFNLWAQQGPEVRAHRVISPPKVHRAIRHGWLAKTSFANH